MNIPVFFIADVSELRMELIFPRSTFSRLTAIGVSGVLWAELPLAGLVGVPGSFEPLAALSAVTAFFSFLPSAIKTTIKIKNTHSKDVNPNQAEFLGEGEGLIHHCWHRPSAAAAPSASSSDSSMSTSLFSLAPSPSSMAFPSSSGSTWARLGPSPRKGESEPVGEGASSEGEGMGESSGPGRVDLRESSFLLRLATRLANAL